MAFWASGRVPAGLGAAASISDLAITGAPGTILAASAIAIGVGINAYRRNPGIARAARFSYAAKVVRRAIHWFKSEAAKSPPKPKPAPFAERHPRLDRAGQAVRSAVERWSGLLILAFLLLVAGSLAISPTWVTLALAAYGCYIAAGIYIVQTWEKPALADLVIWTAFLTVLGALSASLAPRPELAPTVEVTFRTDHPEPGGRYSLVGRHDGAVDLLACRVDSPLIEVPADNVVAMRFVAQAPLPWAGNEFGNLILPPWDRKYPELWTPLWRVVFSDPWRLGYVQWC